ncbi:MAG: amino acid ABC transporter permease [Synechococcales bacterium]|nr:amino acid ABC transporter permease [Synechococcales bacterium]
METTQETLLPPVQKLSFSQWLRVNLFSSWLNSLLTIGCGLLLVWVGWGALRWLGQAQWAVVTENIRLFLVGRYPVNQVWRMGAVLAVVLGMTGFWGVLQNVTHPTRKKRLQWVFYAALPVSVCLIAYWVNGGWGLRLVRTSLWGGLFLTLFVAAISVLLAFPFSILLAIGRQSQLPILRWLCTGYIELVRGLPLIGILFMAQVMLPLVVPTGLRMDRLVRAIAGLTLFNAAYLAENVRAGLQAIPRGQTEAAKALGLNPLQTLSLIILPQALRMVTPALVGQFISLFKDTSLLSLFALFELTGISRSILSQPQFLGRNAEVYLFIGLIYWLICFSMSRFSQRLEK